MATATFSHSQLADHYPTRGARDRAWMAVRARDQMLAGKKPTERFEFATFTADRLSTIIDDGNLTADEIVGGWEYPKNDNIDAIASELNGIINASRVAYQSKTPGGEYAAWKRAIKELPDNFIDAERALAGNEIYDHIVDKVEMLSPIVVSTNKHQRTHTTWSREYQGQYEKVTDENWQDRKTWVQVAFELVKPKMNEYNAPISDENLWALVNVIGFGARKDGTGYMASHRTLARRSRNFPRNTLSVATAEQRIKTIERIARRAGLMKTIVAGGRLTGFERYAAYWHHHQRQTRVANVSQLFLPKEYHRSVEEHIVDKAPAECRNPKIYKQLRRHMDSQRQEFIDDLENTMRLRVSHNRAQWYNTAVESAKANRLVRHDTKWAHGPGMKKVITQKELDNKTRDQTRNIPPAEYTYQAPSRRSLAIAEDLCHVDPDEKKCGPYAFLVNSDYAGYTTPWVIAQELEKAYIPEDWGTREVIRCLVGGYFMMFPNNPRMQYVARKQPTSSHWWFAKIATVIAYLDESDWASWDEVTAHFGWDMFGTNWTPTVQRQGNTRFHGDKSRYQQWRGWTDWSRRTRNDTMMEMNELLDSHTKKYHVYKETTSLTAEDKITRLLGLGNSMEEVTLENPHILELADATGREEFAIRKALEKKLSPEASAFYDAMNKLDEWTPENFVVDADRKIAKLLKKNNSWEIDESGVQ